MPKNQAAPITQDAAIQEMNRLLFEAPIAELAESQGISIDEAVKLRVEKSIEAAPLPIEVTVRPIEPMGSLRGYASVNIGGIVVVDFIDMKEKAQNEELMRRLRQCLAADPVKTVLVDMTPLGLVEITRKKTLRPLHEQFSRSEKNR